MGANGCPHERGHIIDSLFHGSSYGTAESRRIFCDTCRIRRWVDVEAALALSQAEVDLIPQEAAAEIAGVASGGRIDLAAVERGMEETRHSLVPVLRALEDACRDGAGEYVHYGATTQDIQDTAQALEMGEVLELVDGGLQDVLQKLREFAIEHRDTLMVGRTHARPALPTTFGLKVASWLDELLRHMERLEEMRPRMLVAELHGGVGTMAGFQGRGQELLAHFAERLGLGRPRVGWHVARDRVAEFAGVLAMVTASLGRIAEELRALGRPEVGEVEEGWSKGRVGSSTMPHKRNPEACQQVVVLARLARDAAGSCTEAMILEHERDSRGLRLEWPALAEVFHYVLAALSTIREILFDLEIHEKRMRENAAAAANEICTQSLMLELGFHLGKQSAYGLVYELSQASQDEGRLLRAAAKADPRVTEHLSAEELERVFDPGRQLGEAGRLVDEVVAQVDALLSERS